MSRHRFVTQPHRWIEAYALHTPASAGTRVLAGSPAERRATQRCRGAFQNATMCLEIDALRSGSVLQRHAHSVELE